MRSTIWKFVGLVLPYDGWTKVYVFGAGIQLGKHRFSCRYSIPGQNGCRICVWNIGGLYCQERTDVQDDSSENFYFYV